jgi:hypothetical protein
MTAYLSDATLGLLISRLRPNDGLREEANPLRETDDLLSRINVICPVQPPSLAA